MGRGGRSSGGSSSSMSSSSSSSRSSGGGSSSRSFGGGSGSSHRGGYSSSSSRSSSSRSSNRPNYNDPTYYGGSSYNRSYNRRYNRGYGNRYNSSSYVPKTPGQMFSRALKRSIGSYALIIIWGIIVLFVLWGVRSFPSESIAKSTRNREKMDSIAVVEAEYIVQEDGWSIDIDDAENGLKHFFKETGIQPTLYLTETINGNPSPSSIEAEEFATKLYDELFEDEGHLLVIFQEFNEDGNYSRWALGGANTKAFFDSEARRILFDYIDSYYYSDLSDGEYFGTCFSKTADRIMTVTRGPMFYFGIIAFTLIIVSGVCLILIVLHKKKKEENRHKEAMLNADLETFSEKQREEELENLQKKYEDVFSEDSD